MIIRQAQDQQVRDTNAIREYGASISNHVKDVFDLLQVERDHLNAITNSGKDLSAKLRGAHQYDYQQMVRLLEFMSSIAKMMASGDKDAWDRAETDGITRDKFGNAPTKVWKDEDGDGQPDEATPDANKVEEDGDLTQPLLNAVKKQISGIHKIAPSVDQYIRGVAGVLASAKDDMSVMSNQNILSSDVMLVSVALACMVQALENVGPIKKMAPMSVKREATKIAEALIPKLSAMDDRSRFQYWSNNIFRAIRLRVKALKTLSRFAAYVSGIKIARTGNKYEKMLTDVYSDALREAEEHERIEKAFSVHVAKMIESIQDSYNRIITTIDTYRDDPDMTDYLNDVISGLKWMGQIASVMVRRGEESQKAWNDVVDNGLRKMSNQDMENLAKSLGVDADEADYRDAINEVTNDSLEEDLVDEELINQMEESGIEIEEDQEDVPVDDTQKDEELDDAAMRTQLEESFDSIMDVVAARDYIGFADMVTNSDLDLDFATTFLAAYFAKNGTIDAFVSDDLERFNLADFQLAMDVVFRNMDANRETLYDRMRQEYDYPAEMVGTRQLAEKASQVLSKYLEAYYASSTDMEKVDLEERQDSDFNAIVKALSDHDLRAITLDSQEVDPNPYSLFVIDRMLQSRRISAALRNVNHADTNWYRVFAELSAMMSRLAGALGSDNMVLETRRFMSDPKRMANASQAAQNMIPFVEKIEEVQSNSQTPEDPQGENKDQLPGRKDQAKLPGRKDQAKLPGRKDQAKLPGRKDQAKLPGRKDPAQLTGGDPTAELSNEVQGAWSTAFDSLSRLASDFVQFNFGSSDQVDANSILTYVTSLFDELKKGIDPNVLEGLDVTQINTSANSLQAVPLSGPLSALRKILNRRIHVKSPTRADLVNPDPSADAQAVWNEIANNNGV